MKYERIIFLKRNNELVGIGIQKDGIKKLLTLNEAIKEASILKEANKDNAIEFLNTKKKVEKARVELNNEKPKKKIIDAKGVAAITIAAALLGTTGGYALTKSFDSEAKTAALTGQGDAIVLDKDVYDAVEKMVREHYNLDGEATDVDDAVSDTGADTPDTDKK